MMDQMLHVLENKLLNHERLVEDWFDDQWKKTKPPVYGSVDLRNAGFKLAPVDMNLFPAGFNNLNPAFFSLSVFAAKATIHELVPHAKRILIIPESHTRNPFYWQSVAALKKMLVAADFDVRVGFLDPDLREAKSIEGITVQPLVRRSDQIIVENEFVAEVILLNNDLSDSIPAILTDLTQAVLPPAELGWSRRLKSNHFFHYEKVSQAFSEIIQIDPWLISPLFRQCGDIDFMHHEGEEKLIADSAQLFLDIQKKYEEYKIPHQPFLIIKADAGTYGMAVMTVRNVDDLRHLNRKERTKMSTIKGGRSVSRVMMQEGIYTFETWGPDEAVAEPVLYLWGRSVVGGFYRVHQERGVDENLNSPGMQFEPLAFEKPCHESAGLEHPGDCQNRFYAYGVIARLSMLAAARELSEQAQ